MAVINLWIMTSTKLSQLTNMVIAQIRASFYVSDHIAYGQKNNRQAMNRNCSIQILF